MLVVETTLTDEMCEFSCIGSAYRVPDDRDQGEMALKAGRYVFLQLPFAPADGAALMPFLHRFACSLQFGSDRHGTVHVRLYKESRLMLAVQLISPERATGE